MDCSVNEKKIFAKILDLLNISSQFQKKFGGGLKIFLGFLFFRQNKLLKIRQFHASEAILGRQASFSGCKNAIF